MSGSSYIIDGGRAGKERLDLLGDVFRLTTQHLLARTGLAAGKTCIDLGCGGGHVTREMASIVGPGGRVLGVDFDPEVIALARRDADEAGLTNVEFRVGDANEIEGGPFDYGYARMLLSHVAEPEAVVSRLAGVIRPGGTVVIEDVDLSACYSYPPDWSVDRFVTLYVDAAAKRGADATLARRLPALMKGAGIDDVYWDMFQLMHDEGDHKALLKVTMERIAPAVIDNGLATRQEVDEIVDRMSKLTADPESFVALPRVTQAWGTVTAG